MEKLKLPYALNEQNALVSVLSAFKSEKYRCPRCLTLVILKEGNLRTKHFSHPKTSKCSNESIEHLVSKSLIKKAFEDNAAGIISLKYEYICQICHELHSEYIPAEHYSHAELEVQIDDFVCDVVAFKNNDPLLAIEVLHSHAIGQLKAEVLPISWIEVDSQSVIEDPTKFIARHHSLLNSCGRSFRFPKQRIKKTKSLTKKHPPSLVPVLKISALSEYKLIIKGQNELYRTAFLKTNDGTESKIEIPEDYTQGKGLHTLTGGSFIITDLGYLAVNEEYLEVVPYDRSITVIPNMRIEVYPLEQYPLISNEESINQVIFFHAKDTIPKKALVKIHSPDLAYSAGVYTIDTTSFKVSLDNKLILDVEQTKLIPLSLYDVMVFNELPNTSNRPFGS